MSLPSGFSSVKLTAMNTERACKERFYPTPEQALLLAQSVGCARFVYNNTLKFRTDAEGVLTFGWLSETSSCSSQGRFAKL